jgi:uncharacterized repeat protein (TIGR02543 family)
MTGATTISYNVLSSGLPTKRSTFSFVVNSIPTYTLSVTNSNTAGGVVTSNPTGINCGSTCLASYVPGTNVALIATANAGYTFAGWGGACTGTGTCSVTMDQAKSVTAGFNLIPLDYSISAPGLIITQGSTASQTVTITRTQGTQQQPVTITLGTLPSGINAASSISKS